VTQFFRLKLSLDTHQKQDPQLGKPEFLNMESIFKTWRLARQLWREEDGPTAVEYAVILGFIIAVCIGSVNILADRLKDNFDTSAEEIISASN
jgi:pilus assembly protein Flp/PilA